MSAEDQVLPAIFCNLCNEERPSDSFSTMEQRRYLQRIEGDEFMCLRHTSTSSFNDCYNSDEDPMPVNYNSSVSSESDESTGEEEEEGEEGEEDNIHAKRTSYYVARARYALLGEYWARIYDRLLIKYAFYTKDEMIGILMANDRDHTLLLELDRRDLYFNEFVDVLIDSRYDAQRCIDGSIRPIDVDSDSEPSSSSSSSLSSSSSCDEFNTLSQSETEEDEEEEPLPPKRSRNNDDEVVLVHSHGMSTRSRSVISRLNNGELNLE